MPKFNNELLKEFLEIRPITVVILALLILLSIVGLKKMKETKFDIKMLVYGSLCIALSFVLSYIKLFSWPQGGSITPASMLPIIVFSSIFGAIPGMVAGLAYGLLQFIQDAYILHWAQVFLDYPLAFGAIGLAGIFKNNLPLSSLTGGLGRMFFHFLSGFIFFGSYAPEGMHPAMYSLLVNGLLIGTETVICVAVSLLPQVKSVTKTITKQASA